MSYPSLPEPTCDPLSSDARVRRAEGYHAWVVLFFAANLATIFLLTVGHFLWAVPVFFLPAPWYAWQILRPSTRGLGPAVTHFRTDQSEVWLTIDDGPHPITTPAMLELLDSHQARATFFLVGQNVQRHPELVSEILRRGHTIGNHTQTHPQNTFWFAGSGQNAREIDACTDALRKTGVETRYFRPPVGLKNHALHLALVRRGLDLVLWSARGFDTICDDPKKSLTRISGQLKSGAIILVHETPDKLNQQNELVSGLLTHLDREGYRCVIPPYESLVR
jgi:peptidoglycan/xylan/chitin deacetylase (PgdA/CDA1 family)